VPNRGCALSRFGILVFSLTSLLLCVVAYIIINLEPIDRRLAALPHYASTYIRELRPKPPLPTPPPVSAADLQAHLAAAAEFEPPERQADNAQTQTADVPESPDQGRMPALRKEEVIELMPVQPAVTLAGFQHEWQTWNNCGPATVSMNLSYYGLAATQVEAAAFLKPNEDDKNVSPHELVAYARSRGYEGVAGQGGDIHLLKHLLSNGLPVITETWVEPEDNGGMGHYYLLTGYDEAANHFKIHDSLDGPDVTVNMDVFDTSWRVFNRTYVVVFPPKMITTVYGILGPRGDPNQMIQQTLVTAQTEVKHSPEDAFVWFNLGTSYAKLGKPKLAAGAFDQARTLGLPYRMLWYQFEMFDVYLIEERYEELIALTTATLQATGGSEEMYYYRGLAQQSKGQQEAAIEDFRAAVEYNPRFTPAAEALAALDNSG
jgi:tetratricopeptide (TPR) repeat protein